MPYSDKVQSRKWILTINNPCDVGLEHDAIKDKLQLFGLRYWCMSDERASTGTHHTHLFIYSDSPIRFSTIKNRFPVAHIDKCYGSCKENKEYILKQGKWENTEKAETSIEGTFEELGVCPDNDEEKDIEKSQLIEMIKDGATNTDILAKFPNYAFKLKEIDYLRTCLFENRYEKEFRNVEVNYLFGEVSNSKKIKYVYDIEKNKSICLIPNYEKNITFDNYRGQEVLIIEFDCNKLSMNTIINLMKGVPIQLPARFSNKQSSYKKLYLISDIPLNINYNYEQGKNSAKWNEFINGFNNILEYKVNDEIYNHSTGEITKGEKL